MKQIRLSAIIFPGIVAIAVGLPVGAGADTAHREHLIVLTEAGPQPQLVEVASGDRIVWINRSATAMTAIRFATLAEGDRSACAEERGFRRLEGVPLFTSLLAPGSIAVTCAPATRQSLRYELSGDAVGQGWVVVGGATP